MKINTAQICTLYQKKENIKQIIKRTLAEFPPSTVIQLSYLMNLLHNQKQIVAL